MKYKDGYLMREDVRSLMPVHGKKLGVKLVCVWSHFVKTPFKYVLSSYSLSI